MSTSPGLDPGVYVFIVIDQSEDVDGRIMSGQGKVFCRD